MQIILGKNEAELKAIANKQNGFAICRQKISHKRWQAFLKKKDKK